MVFDADQLARAAIEPGTPGFDAVLDRFGTTVVGPDGAVDREVLADVVFEDEAARRDLEGIIHPEVGRLFREATDAPRDTDDVVVHDIPLLVEAGMQDLFDVVVVVEAPDDVRVARLGERGMPEEEVLERMAAQAGDEERSRVADVVGRNVGDVADLERRVEELWRDLQKRAGMIEAP